MPRRRTWITFVVPLAAGLALLAILAIAVGPRLVGEARLRAQVERRLTAALGRPVTVRGPVRVTTGVAIDVDVSGVTIQGLAEIQRVRASVTAASLVSGPLAIGVVRLDAPTIHLAVDPNGRGSWQGLGGAPDPQAPARAWTLDGLAIERGTLRYTDARDGTDLALVDWRADVGRVALPAPADVRTAFRVTSRGAALGRAELAARLVAAPAEGRYAIEALAAKGAFDRAGASHAFEVNADRAEYAGAAGTATLRALHARVLGVGIRADGRIESLATAPRVDATFATEPFAPRDVLAAFAVALPPMRGPDAFATASVRGRVSGRLDAPTLDALDATLDDTRLTGRASRVAGRVADANPKARARVNATPDAGAPTGWRFDLAADRLVVDRYLKPERLHDTSPVRLPLDLLKSLDVAGTLRVGELVASGVRLRNVTVDLDGAPAP
jgi:hypothetical protein